MRRRTKTRIKKTVAWTATIGGLIGWPVSAKTFASEEPPVVLALSWIAIILTGVDGIMIADES